MRASQLTGLDRGCGSLACNSISGYLTRSTCTVGNNRFEHPSYSGTCILGEHCPYYFRFDLIDDISFAVSNVFYDMRNEKVSSVDDRTIRHDKLDRRNRGRLAI